MSDDLVKRLRAYAEIRELGTERPIVGNEAAALLREAAERIERNEFLLAGYKDPLQLQCPQCGLST